jgi:hypothetical protein
MKPYKLQLVQALNPEDLAVRYEFFGEILTRIENDLPVRFIFNDEATFHINGKVNRHYIRVWRTENPYVTLEHERESSEVNVFCVISKEKVYDPFFFVEITVTGNYYQDMHTLWFLSLLEEDSKTLSSNKRGGGAYFLLAVRNHLNAHLTRRWIGRGGANDVVWCR